MLSYFAGMLFLTVGGYFFICFLFKKLLLNILYAKFFKKYTVQYSRNIIIF